MNIFYVPITNKIALKNYENTIKNRVNFENEDICNLTNNCGVWGFNNKERNKKELLIANHIKPWSISNEEERLDLNNVLLFCSMHDTLFDKEFITFDDEGKIIISNELDQINRVFSNINLGMKISINEEKKKYLKYHRENIFKK